MTESHPLESLASGIAARAVLGKRGDARNFQCRLLDAFLPETFPGQGTPFRV